LADADPRTLSTRSALVPLAAQIAPQAATLDDAGRLWLLDAATGDLVRVDGSTRSIRRGAARPGAALLTVAGGAPVLVDTDRRTATALDPSSGAARATVPLDLNPGERV